MRSLPALLLAALAAGLPGVARAAEPLVACADPNNLPFSDRAGHGFENALVRLLARELKRPVRYVWWAQRRGYVRNTLNESRCDLWPGVASGVEMVATTRPWYRSTYVFVTRAADPLDGLTLDDPRLKSLTIGVQMIGNDAMNTPPAHALAARGLTGNVRGFMVYGDYARPDPAGAIVRAVADGRLDVALVWGPVAGYYAARAGTKLRLERVTPWLDRAQWPMVYDISVGVRRDEPALARAIEAILDRRADEVHAILTRFGVPLVE